jgi:hypothetical protein
MELFIVYRTIVDFSQILHPISMTAFCLRLQIYTTDKRLNREYTLKVSRIDYIEKTTKHVSSTLMCLQPRLTVITILTLFRLQSHSFNEEIVYCCRLQTTIFQKINNHLRIPNPA